MKSILLSTILIFSIHAFSQTCKDDSAKLCPGVSDNDMSACMAKNMLKWSEGCRAEMKAKAEANPQVQQVKEANKDKIDKMAEQKKTQQSKFEEMKAKGDARIAKRKACAEKTKELWSKRDEELKTANEHFKKALATKEKDAYKKSSEEKVAIRKKYEEERKNIVDCK